MSRSLRAVMLAVLSVVPAGVGPIDEADWTWLLINTRNDYEVISSITPESEGDQYPRFPLWQFAGDTTFTEFPLAPGQSAFFNDPLTFGIPNTILPAGLTQPGLAFQSNMAQGGLVMQPRGLNGLIGFGPGSGFTSKVLLSATGVDGLDILITTGEPIYAVAFDVVTAAPSPNVRIRFFDSANAMIGEFMTTGSPGGDFFGTIRSAEISAQPSIARINITALTPMGTNAALREGVDNVDIRASAP